MPHLDLSDDEAAALIKELADITGNDRYPFSARIQTLRAILAKLRSEPVREPLPVPKMYTPPRATAARRRRRG
jgi:ParB-like chromosome segregation protein Spo0J